jgi:thiazole tautomerase (transcriptional regulator TenI)
MSDDRVMPGFPVVHAVTDSSVVAHEDFYVRAEAVMRAMGPRGAIHLRSSRITSRRFYDVALTLSRLQAQTGCWLIVNDRVDIAAAVGARGVQLASHSLSIAEARTTAHDLPVGASVHSVEEAVEAQAAGASWCVAGTVFETPSHVGRAPARVEFIQRVTAAVTIPVIAIGGILPDDVGALRAAGAHGVATIRGAGWDHAVEASGESRNLHETRLFRTVEAAFPEPVTRYISAYDSESGSGRDDNADGQRRSQGAGAE